MEQQMQAFFKRGKVFGGAGFPGSFGASPGMAQADFGTGLVAGEDQDSVFYTLDTGGQAVSNVNVTVENGYVSIDAEMSDKSSNTYAHSSVSQTFPVPAGVNPDSARVDNQGDSIVIRFDKVS